VSLPADMGQLNCAAYLAGIIAGILDSARFVSHLHSLLCVYTCTDCKTICNAIYGVAWCGVQDAKVTAHLVHQPEGDRTVFLIKFSPEVHHHPSIPWLQLNYSH
jgi:hypothetical protein